jgi:dihydrofolate reductase
MTKVVFTRTLASNDDRVVIHGDLAAELCALKPRDGRNIVLSCGPAALAPLVTTPGLIDKYLIVVHPAVIGDGPELFGDVTTDLGLRLNRRQDLPGRLPCAPLRATRPTVTRQSAEQRTGTLALQEHAT